MIMFLVYILLFPLAPRATLDEKQNYYFLLIHLLIVKLTDGCAFEIEYWYNDCLMPYLYKSKDDRNIPKERMGEIICLDNK